ncbi:MAG: ComEC/Rec2 family competence protein [Patescibacteria group bacterium]
MRNMFLAGSILLLGAAAFSLWGEIADRQYLQVHFLDMGQGDAILIQTPQGHDILIDGGPDEKVLEKLGKEMAPWNRDIELMVLTHGEADHISGLVGVLKAYEVKQVLWNKMEKETKVFAAFKSELEKEDAHVVEAEAGQEIRWGTDSALKVLLADKEASAFNDSSVVLLLEAPSFRVLLLGDITKAGERKLVSEGDLAVDVLKAAHHGSKTSSSRELLEAARPRIAVISVGAENLYGHPAPEVLGRFAEYGIEVLRTDMQGDISFRIPSSP